MSDGRQTLLARMQAVALDCADRVAVREGARETSYRDFGQIVGTYRAMLQARETDGRTPVGLLLERSTEAYAAMWAAIGEGRAYVPLNTGYPDSRLRTIIEAAGTQDVITTPKLRDKAVALGLDPARVLVLEDAGAADCLDQVWAPRADAGDVAYVLYTSGSTGAPKGVPISYDNLSAFIENMQAAVPFPSGGICSQVCELSFDVSVHEIFLALLSGSTLCPARQIDLFNPAGFIRKNAISVWVSVPSLIRVLLANQAPDAPPLESVRLSICNGEPFNRQIAESWQAVVPHAEVWNTYGPTECTVAVTAQLWRDRPELSEIDVVSIGVPLPGCEVAVLADGEIIPLDPEGAESTGELLLHSAQRFAGYSDPAIAKPFISDESGAVYYKTGDRVLFKGGRIYHLGRLDHQVKIGGHRIELMEVEFQLRRALGIEALAVVTYPRTDPKELVLFLEGTGETPRLDAETLGLPGYMIPKRSVSIKALPTTPHGKLDRLALQSQLEATE